MPTEFTEKHPSKPVSSKSRKSQLSSRKSSSRAAPPQPVEEPHLGVTPRAVPPPPVEEPGLGVPSELAKEDLNESFLAAGECLHCLIIRI